MKAEILSAILEHARAKRYTQAQLIDILDEYQPSLGNLLKGQISQVSIEKLSRDGDRLHLQTSVAVQPIDGGSRRVRIRATASGAGSGAKTGSGSLAIRIMPGFHVKIPSTPQIKLGIDFFSAAIRQSVWARGFRDDSCRTQPRDGAPPLL
jgi:predicted XRE-type DNA-binding protein